MGLLSEYSTSFSPSTTATDKLYAIDQGMVYATSRASQRDIGKREVGSLEVAMGKTGLSDGLIITLRKENRIACECGRIDVVPAWMWSLLD